MIDYQRLLKEVKSYLLRNKSRSNDPSLKMIPHRINLREWSVKKTGLDYYDSEKPFNLGDTLSRVVVEWMLARKGLSLDSWVAHKKQLFAIGSGIMHSYADATLWGSGMEYPPKGRIANVLNRNGFRKLDIRAVRGPLSREVLLKLGYNCPEVYGDPAILMPLIYSKLAAWGGWNCYNTSICY